MAIQRSRAVVCQPLRVDQFVPQQTAGGQALACPSQCETEVALMAPITRPMLSPACRSGSRITSSSMRWRASTPASIARWRAARLTADHRHLSLNESEVGLRPSR